jgi:hypothetical protein
MSITTHLADANAVKEWVQPPAWVFGGPVKTQNPASWPSPKPKTQPPAGPKPKTQPPGRAQNPKPSASLAAVSRQSPKPKTQTTPTNLSYDRSVMSATLVLRTPCSLHPLLPLQIGRSCPCHTTSVALLTLALPPCLTLGVLVGALLVSHGMTLPLAHLKCCIPSRSFHWLQPPSARGGSRKVAEEAVDGDESAARAAKKFGAAVALGFPKRASFGLHSSCVADKGPW